MAPTTNTIKKLFALSGKECSFPSCNTPTIENGRIVAEICHIRAQRRGGPRFDPNITDEVRDGYENLLVMCAHHHKVIDDDPATYTIERLMEMKHRPRSPRRYNHASRAILLVFTLAMIGAVLFTMLPGSSRVVSFFQSGGQTAHEITNVGRQDRVLAPAVAASIVYRLRVLPSHTITVYAAINDAEAYRLAEALRETLVKAGWRAESVNYTMTHPPLQGISLQLPSSYFDGEMLKPGLELPELVEFASILSRAGLGATPFTVTRGREDELSLMVGSQ